MVLLWRRIAGGTIALRRTASSLLYNLKPYDPISIVAAALFLGAVAVGASILPNAT